MKVEGRGWAALALGSTLFAGSQICGSSPVWIPLDLRALWLASSHGLRTQSSGTRAGDGGRCGQADPSEADQGRGGAPAAQPQQDPGLRHALFFSG